MPKSHSLSPLPQGIPRRGFIKLAALAGLLAGCRATRQAVAPPAEAPTATPSPTHTSIPTRTATPTSSPAFTPTMTSTPTPMTTPSPTATVVAAAHRPEIIKIHPVGPSKVVHTHHARVWDGENLAARVLGEMLDASITELTGLNDAREAWAALFDPGERVAIKANAFRNSLIWTHVPLVTAVTERLRETGIPAEQIVVFDFLPANWRQPVTPSTRMGPACAAMVPTATIRPAGGL